MADNENGEIGQRIIGLMTRQIEAARRTFVADFNISKTSFFAALRALASHRATYVAAAFFTQKMFNGHGLASSARFRAERRNGRFLLFVRFGLPHMCHHRAAKTRIAAERVASSIPPQRFRQCGNHAGRTAGHMHIVFIGIKALIAEPRNQYSPSTPISSSGDK